MLVCCVCVRCHFGHHSRRHSRDRSTHTTAPRHSSHFFSSLAECIASSSQSGKSVCASMCGLGVRSQSRATLWPAPRATGCHLGGTGRLTHHHCHPCTYLYLNLAVRYVPLWPTQSTHFALICTVCFVLITSRHSTHKSTHKHRQIGQRLVRKYLLQGDAFVFCFDAHKQVHLRSESVSLSVSRHRSMCQSFACERCHTSPHPEL